MIRKILKPKLQFKYLYNTNKQFKNQILDSKQEEIWKKISNLKQKILEAKFERVIKLNAEIYDDYYEDLKQEVEELYETYGKLKEENEIKIQEIYRPKMIEIQKEMDGFWNTLYNSRYEKFNEAEEENFNSIFSGNSKFWSK